jgi:phage tail tape-measure protein
MRLAATGAMAVALAAMLSACAPGEPEDAAGRAAVGSVIGAAAGAALGATVAINPALGAEIGAVSGAAIGAAAGAATATPEPTYEPVAVPADSAAPHFYDNWPPGFYRPPGNPETVSPHAG